MRIVGGEFRGRSLVTPKSDDIRPTTDRTRESLFNILSHAYPQALDGTRVLDLFAGTGALGLEALSRGAASIVFVDTSAEARGLIRDHIEAFGAGGVAKLLRRDATALGPAGTMGPMDLVFLDPPYGKSLGEAALASALSGKWLAPGALIVWEEGSAALPPAGLTLLDQRRYGDTHVTLLRAPA